MIRDPTRPAGMGKAKTRGGTGGSGGGSGQHDIITVRSLGPVFESLHHTLLSRHRCDDDDARPALALTTLRPLLEYASRLAHKQRNASGTPPLTPHTSLLIPLNPLTPIYHPSTSGRPQQRWRYSASRLHTP